MPKPLNLVGQRFGRLIVIKETDFYRQGKTYWLCECDCGKTKTVAGSHLTSGKTQSCRCLQKEVVRQRVTTHGLSRTRVWNVWNHMRRRCYDPKDKDFASYGGRGIVVCDRWKDSLVNFVKDMNEPPPKATLDRIDNDGSYSPENCRWATMLQQSYNRRTNRFIEYRGKDQTLKEWAKQLGIGISTLHYRLRLGWSIERAFNDPIRKAL